MVFFNLYPYLVVLKSAEVDLCEPLEMLEDDLMSDIALETVESVRLNNCIEQSVSVYYLSTVSTNRIVTKHRPSLTAAVTSENLICEKYFGFDMKY